MDGKPANWALILALFAPAATLDASAALTMNNVVAVTVDRLEETNGDLDGFLDSNESAEIVLALANKSTVPLLAFSVRVLALDPHIDTVAGSVQFVPYLAPGATATLDPITIHVSAAAHRAGPDVSCQNPGPAGICSNYVTVAGGCNLAADCLRTATQDYYARLRVEALGPAFTSLQVSQEIYDYLPKALVVPDEVVLDLDLNAAHPSISTSTYVEGFESGLGTFTFQNLDANKASNALSDGYRCQYHDPDYVNSNSYGEMECYLGFAGGQTPINDWHVHLSTSPDGGRAYLGSHSLHYGKHIAASPPFAAVDTVSLSQLDAIRIRDASRARLAARVCQNDPSPDPRACTTAADCAAVGGRCVPSRPQLSFKQQVSSYDGRIDGQRIAANDRAVVEVLVLGSGVWTKIHPSVNVYNAVGSTDYVNCRFDPVDDGNDEDDYFDPADPQRRLGPSSTCYPAFAFSAIGSTEGAFDPIAVEQASDGPGLAGAVGPGTWVESRFDLSRFRGRAIVIRFLYTSIKASDLATYEDVFWWNPVHYDDGWYVDDVRVTQTLGLTATTVTTDDTDNASLPGATDADGDGRPDDFDCAPADGGSFAPPPEVFGLSRPPDKTTLSWESSVPFAGAATVHDVLQGALGEWPVGSGASEECAAPGVAGGSVAVGAVPAAGSGSYYLVRARNACGAGIYGRARDGSIRTSAACP